MVIFILILYSTDPPFILQSVPNNVVYRNGTKFKTLHKEMKVPYLWFWLFLNSSIQRPSVNRDVLMLPASFRRSPVVCVLACLSDPAKSQRDNLHHKHILHLWVTISSHFLENVHLYKSYLSNVTIKWYK